MKVKIIQNKQKYNYSFQEVKNGDFLQDNLAIYFTETLLFCQSWLNGQTTFKLKTSGSTGKPKEIVINRSQMQASAKATVSKLVLSPNTFALVCINTKYIGGKMMLVRALEMNWELLIIEPTRNPVEIYLDYAKEDKILDFTALVPLQLQAMLEASNKNILNVLDNMKAIIVGGAKVSEGLKEKATILNNVALYSTYGMTETVSHIALQRFNTENNRDYFETLPEVEIGIDTRKCLKIKAPVTRNEWIQSNDLVEILDEKHFKVLGRVDNIINSAGIKIQAEKVEKAVEKVLMSLDKNIRFFVIGLPSQDFGEELTLLLETDEIVQNYLLDKLKIYLSKYEIPKKVFCINPFIETESGKIDKNLIKKQMLK